MEDTETNGDPSLIGDDPSLIGYAEAIEELEQILNELEDDSIDIDVLSDRVERAAELIKICRGRINVAQTRVSAIVADLDELAEATTPPAG